MIKNTEAGSQLTANQIETTCKRVLNCRTDKNSRQIIDAENCFRTRTIHGFSSAFIDCDTLQAAREENIRYAKPCTAGQNYIEVA